MYDIPYKIVLVFMISYKGKEIHDFQRFMKVLLFWYIWKLNLGCRGVKDNKLHSTSNFIPIKINKHPFGANINS